MTWSLSLRALLGVGLSPWVRAGLVAVLVLCASGCRCDFGPNSHAEAEDERPSYGDGLLLELDLTGGVTEGGTETLLGTPGRRTYVRLIRVLEKAAADERLTGVLLRLGSAQLGMAQSEEVSRLLQAVKAAREVPVWCHADQLSNSTALLTTGGCDHIWVSAGGGVDTVGVSGQVVYLYGLFERLGIQPDFLSAGRYKTAAESLTRSGPSPEAKQAFTSLFQSIQASWLMAIRNATSEQVARAAELGPYDPGSAKAAGLITDIGYDSEARETAEKGAEADRTVVAFGGQQRRSDAGVLFDLIRALDADSRSEDGDFIAVLTASGAISQAAGGMFDESGIASDSFVRRLRLLERNDDAKAVVIRIDSPGGSALASDLIWHEVMKLRKSKPVIASVGAMAASGGYYIAAATDRVFAENTSIVGSIGVVSGKIVIGPALEKVGIRAVSFPGSKTPGAEDRAGYASALTPWGPAQRERMQTMITSIYDLFISRVVEGRGISEAQVRKVAEGRVWTGAQGLSNQLVDQIGGLGEAVAEARRRADVDDDVPMRLVFATDGLLETLLFGSSAEQSNARRKLVGAQSHPVLEAVPAPLRAWAESVMPLAGNERVVAAMPFAVSAD